MASGKPHRIYLRGEQEVALQQQANRLGIEVSDLIKVRISSPSTEEIQVNLKKLTERTHHLELILIRLCHLMESNLVDTAYVRGAIEVQASRNEEAIKRAEELEVRRLQMAQRIREEVEQYL